MVSYIGRTGLTLCQVVFNLWCIWSKKPKSYYPVRMLVLTAYYW